MQLLPIKIKEVLRPQVELIKGKSPFMISHRKINNRDFYWLANNSGFQQDVTLLLRDGSGAAEIWDCETGEIKPVFYNKVKDGNLLTLPFEKYEGFWLAFDPQKAIKKIDKNEPTLMSELTIDKGWQISYPETDTVWLTSTRTKIIENSKLHKEYLKSEYDDSDWYYVNMAGNIRLDGRWKATMFYNPDPTSKRYYRYKFVLEDKAEKAIININADNAVKFWVNGNSVTPGKNADSWAVFDTHKVANYLKKGENVIAVEETNRAGYGWMIMQGLILLNNGKRVEILTDKSWKETQIFYSGWQKTDFNDHSWKEPLAASEKVANSEFKRMRPPNRIIFSKSTVWWRIKVIPNAQSLTLPGIDKNALVWIDGKKAKISDDKLQIPSGAKVIIIKNNEDADGLSKSAVFHCKGRSESALISWLDMGLRRFTGFMDYETNFIATHGGSQVTLDLGKVRFMAEVWLNDQKIGERLWPPYIFNTNRIKKGNNTLRIRVGNLMVNRMGGEDDLGRLRTWGWKTPPDSSFEGGLFGPVKVSFY